MKICEKKVFDAYFSIFRFLVTVLSYAYVTHIIVSSTENYNVTN